MQNLPLRVAMDLLAQIEVEAENQSVKRVVNQSVKRVVIVDFGSQYCFLIGRLVRSLGVWCEIVAPNELHDVTQENAAAVILSGGPQSVYHQTSLDEENVKRIILDPKIPVLGICFGMQLMAKTLGGSVVPGEFGEFGHTKVSFRDAIVESVWMSHQDVVRDAGQGSVVLATSPAGIAAFKNVPTKCLAVQFHPEVAHTACGKGIFASFFQDLCGITLGLWNNAAQLAQCKKHVADQIGPEDFVILGLSGGVDSMVCAALLAHVLPPSRWQAVLVDMGIMRQSEVQEVRETCEQLKIPLKIVQQPCFAQLAGVTEPEQKRKIIGALFIEAFKSSTQQKATILCQGTIYPDVIESGRSSAGTSETIKSHHNVGGLPRDLGLKLLEPLRLLFKDEVRELGLQLGLPATIVRRHPFPGPGLAIRIIGEVTPEKVLAVAAADHIFIDHIRQAGLYDKISQAYAGLFDGKSVGVVGDQRRYGWIASLRAVCTDDFMTATAYPFEVPFLERVATDIINRCPQIVRVAYDVTSKPPGTIELE